MGQKLEFLSSPQSIGIVSPMVLAACSAWHSCIYWKVQYEVLWTAGKVQWTLAWPFRCGTDRRRAWQAFHICCGRERQHDQRNLYGALARFGHIPFFWKSTFLWAVLSMGSAEYVQSSGDDEALLHMHQVDCDEWRAFHQIQASPKIRVASLQNFPITVLCGQWVVDWLPQYWLGDILSNKCWGCDHCRILGKDPHGNLVFPVVNSGLVCNFRSGFNMFQYDVANQRTKIVQRSIQPHAVWYDSSGGMHATHEKQNTKEM